MFTLVHHPLDPASRLARLMLSEYGVPVDLEEVKPWLREPDLLEINPAGSVPVLIEDEGVAAIGLLATIHHVEARHSPLSMPGLIAEPGPLAAEMWRLVDWVLFKFDAEITRYIVEEKVEKRDRRGATPDPAVLRAAKANLNEHLLYFNWLVATRKWLAGPTMTLADFALAAHLSILDYVGDIDWAKVNELRDWYSRLKSRPAFRTLLNDRILALPPHKGYADLDF